MQYISSEGLLIDTVNKEVRILGSTSTISANSVAFLGETNVVANSSIAFGGSNNIANNDSLIFGGSNNKIDNALAFNTTNSILSGESIDFNSNNIRSEADSVSFRSENTNLTSSIGFRSVDDGLNNNSIAFLSKNNNLDSSVLINGNNNTLAISSLGILISNSQLNTNSILFNSLSSVANLSGVGLNSFFSTISNTSLGINVLSSTISDKSIGFLGSNNNISNNAIGINSLSSNILNNSLTFNGQTNTINNNSFSVGASSSNVSNQSEGFYVDKTTINNNSFAIGGSANNVNIDSIGINSLSSNISNQSKGFYVDRTTLNNNSFAVGGSANNVNTNSVSINSLSSNVLNNSFELGGGFNTLNTSSFSVKSTSSNVSNQSEGFYVDRTTINNNSFAVGGSANNINTNSFAINALSSNISNNSFGFYVDRHTLSNNSFAIGGSANNINTNSVSINSLSSNFTNNVFGINATNTTLNLSSFAVNVSSGNINTNSVGINALSSNISNNSFGVNNNRTTIGTNSLVLNSSAGNINTNSVGINALSSNISNNSIGLNTNSSNVLLSSIVFNTSGSSLSGSFGYNLNNTQVLSGLALNTTNSRISSSVVMFGNNNNANNNALIIEGDNNIVRNDSVILQSNNTDLSGNTFSTLTNNITARGNVSIFNSSNGTISSNAVQINGNNNYLDNNSVSIQGSSNIVSTSSVNIASDSSNVYSDSTNLNGFNNTLSAKSIAISVDSSSLTDRGIAINSFSSNVSTNSISLNSRNVNLRLSAIDLLGSGNNVNTKSVAFNNINSTVQNDGLSINTINSVVSGNSVLLGGNTNRATDNSFVINSSGSNAFVGSVVIGGRATTANLSAASINALNANIRGANSLVLGGSGHDLNSTNSVYLGGQNNRAANTPTGVVAGNNSIIVGGTSNRTGSNGIIIGGRNNDANDGSLIIGGSGNNVGNFKNVVIIGRNDVTAGRNDIVYLPEINALGNLTITGDVTATGTFTRVDTVTGSVSALSVDNLLYDLVPLTVNQRYIQNSNFDTAQFSFYNNPRLAVNNEGIAVNTFDRVVDQALTVAGNVSATGSLNLDNTINIGPDVNLYRSGVNTLKTDDNLNVGTLAVGATDNIVTHASNTLQTRNVNPRVWDTSAPFVSATTANSFTTNRVLKATNGAGIVNSNITDTGTNVGINTTIPNQPLTVSGNISGTGAVMLNSGTTQANGIQFGTDTNLYRSTTDTLRTDDNLIVGSLAVNSNSDSTLVENSGKLEKRNINTRVWDTNAPYVSAVTANSFTPNTVLKAQNGAGIVNSIITDNATNVGIGATTPNEKLTVSGSISSTNAIKLATGTTDANGIQFGTDTNLYRSGANLLKTDDEFEVSNAGGKDTLRLTSTGTDTGITLGVDTNLYRATGDLLKTDDNLEVTLNLRVSGDVTLGNDANDTLTIYAGPVNIPNATAHADAVVIGTDSRIIRSTTNTLSTNANLIVGGLANNSASNSVVVENSGKLEKRTLNAGVWNTTAPYVSATSANSFTTNRVLKAANGAGITNSSITDDGTNVGIGVTDPTQRLDIGTGTIRSRITDGTILIGGGETNLSGAPSTDGFRIRYVGSVFGSAQDGLVIEKTDFNTGGTPTPDGGILFSNVGEGGVSAAALAIRGSGNVGVGTMFPNQTLTVIGNVSSSGALMLQSGITRDNGVQFGTDVSIYRSGADILQTDDTLVIGLSTIVPNMAKPTNQTSDEVIVRNGTSGALFRRDINPVIWNTTAPFLTASSPTINTLQKYTGPNSVGNSNITDNNVLITLSRNSVFTNNISVSGTTSLGNGTSNTVTIRGNTSLPNATSAANSLVLGGDVNLYRSAADVLRTDDNLLVGTLATSTTDGSVVVENSGTLRKRNINPRVWNTTANILSGSSLTVNRIAKISTADGITNSNITDDGTNTTVIGTNLLFKNTSKVFDLFNDTTNYFRFDHATNGILKFAYNNTSKFEVNGTSNYVYTPNQILIDTTTTGTYKLRVNGTSYFDNTPIFANSITVSGEPLIRASQLRIGSSTNSTIFRQDNTNFWILHGTNANAGTNYDTLRPFRINNSTGDVFMANGIITARYSDAKLLVNSSEVMTAATWASLAPANTPIQVIHDIDNAPRSITSKTLAPYSTTTPALGVSITTRKANSKFLLKAVIHHTNTFVNHHGFLLRFGFNDVITAGAFSRPLNSNIVTINFGTAHGLVTDDVIILATPPGAPTLVPAHFRGYSSFRVLSTPNANSITIEATGANTTSTRTNVEGTGARIWKYNMLGASTADTDTTSRYLFRSQATNYAAVPTDTKTRLFTTSIEYFYNPGTVAAGTNFVFETGSCSAWDNVAYNMTINSRDLGTGLRYDMRSESTMTVTELAG